MPDNGEISNRFGVYKSVCCDLEIVIAAGATFPDCPKHPNLVTKWKSVGDEPIRHVSELPRSEKGKSAA